MTVTVLVTGGAGFIGSHCVVELIKEGFECIVLDNFSNSYPECLDRVEKITQTKIKHYNCDILDGEGMDKIFTTHKIEAVIHLAGLKAVGESCKQPLNYYHNNVTGSISLLQAMERHNVNKFVFSSSATVYGNPQYLPIDENHPVGGCVNPYGSTKLVIEMILKDVIKSRAELGVISLRYFNPVGAHESGLIGEDPQGIPNNLMPFITQVAVGRREILQIFGDDYETPDGTGVRDYIHVVDLAIGHVFALKKLLGGYVGFQPYNLGTGNGNSVMQVLGAMQKAVGKEIPYKVAPRREGDISTNYSCVKLVNSDLKWKAERGLDAMCADSWRFQETNPYGYRPSNENGL